MAVRLPLFMEAVLGETAGKMIYPFNASGMNELHKLAGHAYALSPNPRIEVSGSLGDPLPGATFTDTWWSAGASTTDVTNYDTASETPNVFMVTDTYNSLRLVYDVDASPFSSDTNNTQFPLYLYSPEGPDGDDWPTAGLRTMTNQDFVETFIIPTLDQFHGGGSSLEQGGTYFMTTSSSPANATVVGIAALNQEANPAAYSAASITPFGPYALFNYRIAKVNWSPTASTLYESGANYDLPLYYDSGTESIKQHSPATWAALLNPFLRYYLSGQAGVAYKLSYNVDGSDGATNGTLYQDTRITTAGTSYQQRFVNANDYRTQEFPTGTATAQGASKAFKIHRGVNEAITLLGSSGSPQTFTSDGPVFDGAISPSGGWEARNGFKFTSTGNIERITYATFTGGTEVTHSTSEWCNVTPGATRYIRFTDDTSATMGGSARTPATGFSYTASSYEWRLTQSGIAGDTTTTIRISWNGTQVYQRDYSTFALADAETSRYAGGFTYDRAGNASQTYSYTTIYGLAKTGLPTVARVTANTGDALNTWHSLATDKEFRWASQEADETYGARFTQCKVEIASDAAGSNILATGYYNTAWHGGAGDDIVVSALGATSGTARGQMQIIAFADSNGDGGCQRFVGGEADGGTVTITGTTPASFDFGDLPSGFEANWDFSLTYNGGGGVAYGPASTAWVNLSTGATWGFLDNTASTGTGVMAGTFTIRQVSPSFAVVHTSEVTMNVDFIGQSAQLEGTTAVPEVGRGTPVNAPTVNMGWRFNTDGTVEDFDSDNATAYSTGGHINWCDSTPSGTWYIRATVHQSGTGVQTQVGSAMNTWHALSSNRQFIFDDTRAFASYGAGAFVTYKVEISRNNNGTNIAATGYYRWNYEGGA